MAEIKTPPRATPGVIISALAAGLAGIGLVRWLVVRPRRRPSADELMRMDDGSFDEFIRRTGLRSAAELGVTTSATD